MPEIIIPHSEISDPNKITQEMEKRFKEKGLDVHKNDVLDLEDDFKRGVRRLKVKNTKYFFMK